MLHGVPSVFAALEQSGFAAAIRQSAWIYPLANIGHIVALTLFAGALAIMDVRLIGGFAGVAPAPMLALARSFALVAFAAMAATGFLLFAAEAGHLIGNPVFQIKLGLIAAGLVNIAVYQLWAKGAVASLPANAPMPTPARVTGIFSAALWLGVAACGRAIAYF
jgi:hypothetical protein